MTSKSNTSSNQKLQKTVSNLISTVITSLCQQIIQYDYSIDIFGSLSINIDNDMELTVRLNEKYVKKELPIVSHKLPVVNNPQIARIIDIVQNTKRQYNNEVNENELHKSTHDINDSIMDILENSHKESDEICHNFNYKRRPRKPNQTFKHVSSDNFDSSSKLEQDDQKVSSGSDYNDKSLKIDTSFHDAYNNNEYDDDELDEEDDKMDCNMNENGEVDGQTDDYNDIKSNDIIDVETNNNIIAIKALTNKVEEQVNPNKLNYRCTICDRQFKRKFCLTRHKRIHQNFKTYTCNICGLGFDLINQFKRHMRSCHSGIRENLRRSCRGESKTDGQNSTINDLSTSSTNWSKNNLVKLPIDFNKNNVYNAPFSHFNKRPFATSTNATSSVANSSTNTSNAATTASANAVTQNQVRQLLSNIMKAAENNNSAYTNPMYFMPPYSLSSYGTTQNNNTSITNSNPATLLNQKYLYPQTLLNNFTNNNLQNLTKAPLPSNLKPTNLIKTTEANLTPNSKPVVTQVSKESNNGTLTSTKITNITSVLPNISNVPTSTTSTATSVNNTNTSSSSIGTNNGSSAIKPNIKQE